MSTILTIADAVVASLNAGNFSLPFEAQRQYQPVFGLPELETLRVSVVPKSVTIAIAARDSSYFDCAIDIGVQQKVNPDQPGEMDALLGLVEEIADHLRMQRLDGFPSAAWLALENNPLFAPEHLQQERVFTSVLTVTYRVRR